MEKDVVDRTMVKSIAEIGRVMRLPIVAEWVENHAILEMVRAFGIDYAQGFAVYKPRPIEEFLEH